MTVYLRSLETAVPPTVLVQTEARDVFAAQPGLTRLGTRLVGTCFDSAAIDTRYTAVAELTKAPNAIALRPCTCSRRYGLRFCGIIELEPTS